MKTSTFSIQDCEKHFRKYVRRKSDTNSHNFDTTKLHKNAGIINRNRNNSASCTDNKRITLKISEIREMAI